MKKTKKRTQRLWSIVLFLTLVLSMVIIPATKAFAAEESSLHIQNNVTPAGQLNADVEFTYTLNLRKMQYLVTVRSVEQGSAAVLQENVYPVFEGESLSADLSPPAIDGYQFLQRQDSSAEVPGSNEAITGNKLIVYEYKNVPQTTSVSGKIVWNDQNNRFNTRPASTVVLLLQNGAVYKTAVTDAASSFVFDNLELNAPNGLPYTYTVKQAAAPEGYNTSVSGYTITNALKVLYIEAVYIDSSTGDSINSGYYPAYYGSSLTIYAPMYVGYSPANIPSYYFPKVTQDEIVYFTYEPVSWRSAGANTGGSNAVYPEPDVNAAVDPVLPASSDSVSPLSLPQTESASAGMVLLSSGQSADPAVAGLQPYSLPDSLIASLQAINPTFAMTAPGQYTFSLKAGETLVVPNLGTSIHFSVTQTGAKLNGQDFLLNNGTLSASFSGLLDGTNAYPTVSGSINSGQGNVTFLYKLNVSPPVVPEVTAPPEAPQVPDTTDPDKEDADDKNNDDDEATPVAPGIVSPGSGSGGQGTNGGSGSVVETPASGNSSVSLFNSSVPLGGTSIKDNWSILSLVLALIALMAGMVKVIANRIRKNRTQKGILKTTKSTSRAKSGKTAAALIAVITCLLPLILFVTLENLAQSMVLINYWTPLIGFVFIFHTAITLLFRAVRNPRGPGKKSDVVENMA